MKTKPLTVSEVVTANVPVDATVLSAKSFPWHLAAEADEAMVKAYNTLHKIKHEFDQMHELPNGLKPLYDQVMKALGTVDRKETYQLREMMRRAAEQYRGA